MARKYGKKASEKVARTLHEWKRGKLRSGSGGKVTSREQAIAIGLAQARRAGGKVPPSPGHATKASLDTRVRTYLSGMRPGTEIDARGIARALGGGIDPLEADYALERAAKAGHAVTSDGRWFGPCSSCAAAKSSHARRKKQLDREIAASLERSSHSTKSGAYDARPTKQSKRRRTHDLFYLSEDQQGGKHASHFEHYGSLAEAIDALARLPQGSITHGNAEDGPQVMIVWAVPAHTDLLYWTDGDLSAQPRAQDHTKAVRDQQAPRSTRSSPHGSEQYFNNRFEQLRLKHWR